MSQKLLRIILTVGVSVLFSVLIVFVVVNAQSYLRQNALLVEGTAIVEGTATIWGETSINASNVGETALRILGDPNDPSKGKVGIGEKFRNTAPAYKLDVDGTINAEWIRASGARFDTVMVEGRWPTFVVEKYSGLAQSKGDNDPVRVCSSKVTADLCIISYCDIRHLNNDIAKCDLNYNVGLKQWEICAIAAADDDKTAAYAAMMCFDF